jgi:hypothetical protein
MDLRSGTAFKSLPAFATAVTLPQFTVITGLNGSGKTHLLQGLGQQPEAAKNPIALYEGAQRLDRLRLADSGTLAPNAVPAVSRTSMQQEIDNLWNNYQNLLRGARHQFNAQFAAPGNKVQQVAQRAQKPLDGLTQEDFRTHLPMIQDEVTDVFAHSFARLFMRYSTTLTDNSFASSGQKNTLKTTSPS